MNVFDDLSKNIIASDDTDNFFQLRTGKSFRCCVNVLHGVALNSIVVQYACCEVILWNTTLSHKQTILCEKLAAALIKFRMFFNKSAFEDEGDVVR